MPKKIHIHQFVIFISALVLLLGCTVGKKYKRPEFAFPQQYSSKQTSDSSIAKLPWKQFFTDTTLSHLIDLALTNNFNLQLALKRIEASEANAKQARLLWLPVLNALVTAASNSPSQNSLNGISIRNFLHITHLEDYNLSALLSWEIDVWGKIRKQKESALYTYLQTYEAGRAVRTSIVAQVANGYYNLLMMDAQLEITKQNVLLSDSILQLVKLQKASGDVTELAVQQSLAQLQNAKLLVPQLEQAIRLQENALRLLLGDWPGIINRSEKLSNVSVSDSLSTGVPADLLSYRPDVRASEMALVAASARVGVAQASLYPALNISAAVGLNSFKFSNWLSIPASMFGNAAGGLLQPVFQRGMLKTQVKVAKIEREQRVIEFRQSVMGAASEVTNALIKLDKLKEQQLVADERVATLNLAVQNAQLLFRSGIANYLEVISAQSRILQAQLDKAAIARLQLSARVELYQSLGGGWK